MPANIIHFGTQATCPHGGQVTTVTTQSRVFVSGQPVATAGDTFAIAGCAFNVLGAAHPCVKVRWLQAATRVFVGGSPAILSPSLALCEAADLAPQGAPIIMKVQTKVIAT